MLLVSVPLHSYWLKILLNDSKKSNVLFFCYSILKNIMGLSSFDKYSSCSSYCSTLNSQSLTKRLIELSNTPSRSSLRFAHTPEWADGLETWNYSQNSTIKTDLSRRNLDFHDDIGLYLPRCEKPKSAPICLKNLHINSKVPPNNVPPERIRHLLKREKDLLSQNEPPSDEILPKVPTNTYRSCKSFHFFVFFLNSPFFFQLLLLN